MSWYANGEYDLFWMEGNITKKYEKGLLINDHHKCKTSGVEGIMNLLLLHINSFEDDIQPVWVYIKTFCSEQNNIFNFRCGTSRINNKILCEEGVVEEKWS